MLFDSHIQEEGIRLSLRYLLPPWPIVVTNILNLILINGEFEVEPEKIRPQPVHIEPQTFNAPKDNPE
jgi:hypothetical protein